MKAIILAGGKGTRLKPITCELPKPMVPVVNIPLMEHILLLLKTRHPGHWCNPDVLAAKDQKLFW